MGKKSTKIISIIDSIRQKYLLQLKQGNYTRIDFENKYSYKPQIFFDKVVYDIHEEVDKVIVCQWLILKNDWRFENYIPYIFIPLKQEDVSSLAWEDIVKLITPHNIINLEFSVARKVDNEN